MYNLKKTFQIITLLILFSVSYGYTQKKIVKIHSGFGFTDMAHLGITLKISDRIESGIQGGYFPTDINYIKTASLINYINLRYSEKFENSTTTYFKQQLNYYEELSSDGQWTWTTLELLIGSHFNITRSFGISADFGIFATLNQFHRRIRPPSFYESEKVDFPIIFPNIRLQLFVRI